MLYPAELRVHRGAAFSCAGGALQGLFRKIAAKAFHGLFRGFLGEDLPQKAHGRFGIAARQIGQ
jgi:hypothetical protein